MALVQAAADRRFRVKGELLSDVSPGALFVKFLGYGCLAWGGPVAQIAMLRRDLVDCGPEHRWVEPEKFNRVLAIYQALPGPEATELCCYFGYTKARRWGAIAAGLGFILPGLLLMLLLAEMYVRFGLVPGVRAVMEACQPVVVGLICVSAYRIAKGAATAALGRGVLLAVVATTAVLTALGAPFWITLIVGAALAMLAVASRLAALVVMLLLAALCVAVAMLSPGLFAGGAEIAGGGSLVHAPPASAAQGVHAGTGAGPSLFLLAGLGLQAGLLTFGGAYTAIPMLRGVATGQVNANAGWMTTAQLFDGVALVAVLPAPLVTVGAFVGYLGAGLPGALVLVTMIYVPAFGFTLIGHGVMERLVGNSRIHAALDGTAAAAAGLLVGTAIDMATPLMGSDSASIGKMTAALVAAMVLLRFRGRLVVPVVLLAAAVVGVVWYFARHGG